MGINVNGGTPSDMRDGVNIPFWSTKIANIDAPLRCFAPPRTAGHPLPPSVPQSCTTWNGNFPRGNRVFWWLLGRSLCLPYYSPHSAMQRPQRCVFSASSKPRELLLITSSRIDWPVLAFLGVHAFPLNSFCFCEFSVRFDFSVLEAKVCFIRFFMARR